MTSRARLIAIASFVLLACSGSMPPAARAPATTAATAATASTPPPAIVAEPPTPQVPLSRADTWLCPHDDWTECERRCDAQNALSCARLGHLLFRGAHSWSSTETLPPDPPKAREAYRRACDAGYAAGCNHLAVMLADGKGGAADAVAARKLYVVACDRGIAVACANLGIVAGNAGDAARAKQFYRKACELGDGESCMDAADERDVRGLVQGFRRAVRGAPVASAAAAAVLGCPQGTTATMKAAGPGGIGSPEMYCASPNGKKNGPFIEWLSAEDVVEGAPHGVMTARGTFTNDIKDGAFSAWNANGSEARKGTYGAGLEEGEWQLFDRAGRLEESGSYKRGKREGVWIERASGEERRTDYVAGKRHGKEVRFLNGEKFSEGHFVDGKEQGTRTTKWPNGQRCVEEYSAGLRDGTMTCWHPNGRKMSEDFWRANKKISGKDWDERGRPLN